MRATLLVMMTLIASTACRAQQSCQPGTYCPPTVPVYRGTFAPPPPAVVQVPVQVPVHHMRDCRGKDFVHQDFTVLEKFIKERDAGIRAAETAAASKTAENFGLNLAGIKAEAKGTLETNDRDFGARVMNPPPAHEEVPIPEPPAADGGDDEAYKVGLLIVVAALIMLLASTRRSK